MALATSSPNTRHGHNPSYDPLRKPAAFNPTPFGSPSAFQQQPYQTSTSNQVGFASLRPAPQTSLGFGFASSAPFPATSFGFSQPSTSSSFSPQTQGQQAEAGPSTPTNAGLRGNQTGRRRRRDDSSDEDDEEQQQDRLPAGRMIKKMRSPGVNMQQQQGSQQPKADDILKQLGAYYFQPLIGQYTDSCICVLIGRLQQPELLNLFQSLMAQHPSLVTSIQDHLPRPSPSNFLPHLPLLESTVLRSIPAQSRPEYILSRVKVALESYVSDARLSLQTLNVAAEHPATSFTFLHDLTASVQRLERALPPANPSLGQLVPMLFNAWHLFLSRLSTSVNTQGKIVGAELVQRMFDQVQQLASAEGNADGESHRFMLGVAERLSKELGWLANRRSRSSTVEMEEL